jgi:hypothetical protein
MAVCAKKQQLIKSRISATTPPVDLFSGCLCLLRMKAHK